VAGKFSGAAASQKKFAEALYMAGLSNDRCGRKDKAQDFYRQSVGANAKFCKGRVAIAVAELEAGQASAAEREFGQSVADDPQCTEGYVNLAIMQRKRGLEGNKEALSNLRRALAIDAQYLPAFNEMALLYLSEAADNTKKLDLAEVVCSQAQKINAAYAPIYNTWGLIDLRRNKIIDASAKFQKATELDPKIFEAHMNFARITIGFRGYQDAKAAYEQALSLKPSDFEAQLGLGVALRGLQDNAKAEEAYQKATKLQPNRPEPYYNLGVLYQDFMNGTTDEMQKARGYYQEFLSRAGSDKRYAPTVEEIQRKCKQEGGKHRAQGKNACIAGRIQNIQLYLDTMKQMKEMEKLQKEQEKQAADLEASEKAQQQAAPAEPPPEADKKAK
jgi:tetratricopeptide (TPR) repeat protein